ncbi:hypothetical protein [Mucilaginibacter jinjuensis]|uniref:Uncharacterized protein n=1 Tax=Mucilaginibacter jinjuensis TaxID=1176721 RepID=A0ABY7TAI4_9SPHI|nr:hypothetical protein [Mucilaginibacter jinjuensis]WCT12687.1 hypothetical protein PQO05_01920 [Mucilaginibacter jinjuensis]
MRIDKRVAVASGSSRSVKDEKKNEQKVCYILKPFSFRFFYPSVLYLSSVETATATNPCH